MIFHLSILGFNSKIYIFKHKINQLAKHTSLHILTLFVYWIYKFKYKFKWHPCFFFSSQNFWCCPIWPPSAGSETNRLIYLSIYTCSVLQISKLNLILISFKPAPFNKKLYELIKLYTKWIFKICLKDWNIYSNKMKKIF